MGLNMKQGEEWLGGTILVCSLNYTDWTNFSHLQRLPLKKYTMPCPNTFWLVSYCGSSNVKSTYHLVPPENHTKATLYVLRDIIFTFFLYRFAYCITPWAASDFSGYITSRWQKAILKSSLWIFYWWFQGMVGAGIFCLGKSVYKNQGG